MKSVEQHVQDVLGIVPAPVTTELDLLQAHGTVLAEPVASPVSLPGFDNASMDGYAVHAADLDSACEEVPVRLSVVADIPAGDPTPVAIRPGMCARIMTGAPLPVGADAVVPVEWTDGDTVRVTIDRPVRVGNAIRRAGDDVREGVTVLRPGARIGAGEMGVLAAVGRRTVPVYPRPRVVVLSTGEELVEPGRPLGRGQIWESNSFMIAAAARDAGCDVYRHGFVGDDPATVLDTLEGLLVRADIVVTTGGVSMGAHDVVKAVLSQQGVEFVRVAMQPGKPQGFGTLGPDKTPVLTLPGNPVSAFVSFQVFVRPALRTLQGLPAGSLPSVRAMLTAPVTSPPGRRSYLRGVLEEPPHGGEVERAVSPVTRQDSHQLSALADADALVVVPEEVTELPAGAVAETLLLP